MTSLVAVEASVILKDERGENLLQNGIFHFVFALSHSPEIAVQR